MFVIDPHGDTEKTFWAPVTLRLPGGDTHKIRIEFKALTETEIDKIFEAGGSDYELLQQVIVGWKGVYRMQGGKPELSDFDKESLEELLDHRWFRLGVINTYNDHLSGRGVVKRAERQAKN